MIESPYTVACKHATSVGLQDIVTAAVTYDREQIAKFCEEKADAFARRGRDAAHSGAEVMGARDDGHAQAFLYLASVLRGAK